VKKNGEVIDVLFSAAAERDSEGAIIRSLTIVSDVTEHNRLAAALQQEHERTQVTLESIGDAVISTDAEGKVEYLNPVAEEMTGWPLEDARGRRLGEVFRIINETTRNPAEDPVSHCIAEGRVVGLASHTALISRDGREFSIEDSAAPIRDRSGEIIGSVLVFHDVSAQRRLQTEITHQARHDALTGLANRSEFEIQLRQAISEASDSEIQHALCYLDLDQFKLVNDTCGHAAGDELLRQLTAVLKRKIRHNDLLARLGGDEFGVLLRNCTVAQALFLGRKALPGGREHRPGAGRGGRCGCRKRAARR
jgi:PAS domain S-box-containing protein